MQPANKFLRFLSWLISNLVIISLSFAIVLILFYGIQIKLALSFQILILYFLINIFAWLNFLFMPIWTHGYTLGHWLFKLKIIGENPLSFKNLFILSWHNSLLFFNFSCLIVVVNNFSTNLFVLSLVLYSIALAISVLSLLTSLSFFLDKKSHQTWNEINAKLQIISTSRIEEIKIVNKNIEILKTSNIKNANFGKEIDKIIDSRELHE